MQLHFFHILCRLSIASNREFSGHGWKLTRSYHNDATARSSSKLDFSSHGANEHNYLAVDLDVTSKDSINSAFDRALAKFGRVDVVVNNA